MSDFRIKRALIAVYDKTGIVEFARALVDEFGIEIISTGGTAKHLKHAGIPVTMVEQVTGFPEMLDGRVKTLHPKIHAGILADRDNPDHMRQLAEQGITPIDMVVVNLYPFEKTVADPNCTFEQAIEMIDIGGPCMLRAAAKNHKHVLVVPNREYENTLMHMRWWKEKTGLDKEDVETVYQCAAQRAFHNTARYDIDVVKWMDRTFDTPRLEFLELWRLHDSRYGENPHQSAKVYLQKNTSESTLVPAGKPIAPPGLDVDRISFNNYVDGDSAMSLVKELTRELASNDIANKEPPASARAVAGLVGTPPVRSDTTLKEPLASACAVVPPGGTPDSQAAFTQDITNKGIVPPERTSPAQTTPRFALPEYDSDSWLLTWTTYGQWLPGDERGFVSRGHSESGERTFRNLPGTEYSANEKDLEESARERMAGTPVRLTPEQARCAYEAMIDTAARHGITLVSLSVMANHIHVLCQGDQDGSQLMQLFKGNASRSLGKAFHLTDAPRWFTKSGSKRHIKKREDLSAVVSYVQSQQHAICAGSFEGETFSRGEGSQDQGGGVQTTGGVQRGPATARAEARGSLSGALGATGATARAEARGSLGGALSGSLNDALSGPVASRNAIAFIKHTNACGCSIGDDPIDTYRRAYLGDPIAAAGGVLCVNFPVTLEFAQAVMNSYGSWGKAAGAAFFKLDVWIAPSFDDDAIQLITTPTEKRKWGKECRLLAVGDMSTLPDPNELDYKKITGGMLVQTRDLIGLNEDQWKVVTNRAPSESEIADLRFAWLVAKHTKSNAISICRDGMLLGNGAGQMSRVKSCDLAIQLARENGHGDQLKGAVAAGDAFFPVPDGPGKLIDAGITAIIHPGGSNRDADTIALCDQHNVAMILTGTRHFKH